MFLFVLEFKEIECISLLLLGLCFLFLTEILFHSNVGVRDVLSPGIYSCALCDIAI